MRTAGIIAEYNPFHRGHAFQIAQTRAFGATHVVVCMSGNYVQRGDFAIVDKWTRTQMALQNGADLVVELPLRGCLSSGQQFARAGVEMLRSLGIVDMLSFGSECGDIMRLKNVQSAMKTAENENLLAPFLAKGYSFPRAMQAAVETVCSDADLLSNPNDTLALSYLDALVGTGIEPLVIKRVGTAHDSNAALGEYASASMLRELLKESKSVDEYMPKSSDELLKKAVCDGAAPAGIDFAQRAMFAKLRELTASDFAQIEDVSEGLEHRIYDAVRSTSSFSDLVMQIKSKRYTHARIRRIIFRAVLGLFGPDFAPAYLRVLGIGENGAQILSAANPTLPVVSRAGEIKQLGKEAQEQFSQLCRSTDFYMLSQPVAGACDAEMTKGICKLL